MLMVLGGILEVVGLVGEFKDLCVEAINGINEVAFAIVIGVGAIINFERIVVVAIIKFGRIKEFIIEFIGFKMAKVIALSLIHI